MKKLFSYFLTILYLITSSISFASSQTIYIYKDEGVAEDCFFQTALMFKETTKKDYVVKSITAKEVIEGSWRNDASLFVIPGGADLPYCKKLDGTGNKQIKEFVENGGSYLGLCAGGYYGSAYVEFDKGGQFQVLGARELKFFDGTCKGPILAKYDYQTEGGSRAANLNLDYTDLPKATVYYNGGGYFVDADKKPNTTVIAKYADRNNKAAIVHMKIGKGQAVLSGVHPEFDPNLLDSNDPFLAKIKPTLVDQDLSRKELNTKLLDVLLR